MQAEINILRNGVTCTGYARTSNVSVSVGGLLQGLIGGLFKAGAYDLVQEAPSLPTITMVQPQLLYTSNVPDSTPLVLLGFFPFSGRRHTSLYINTDALLTCNQRSAVHLLHRPQGNMC
jgi:hypothetical protein